MTWAEEFLDWCEQQRKYEAEQAEFLESGQAKFFHNHVDVTADAAARHRRNIAELDTLIARAHEDLSRSDA